MRDHLDLCSKAMADQDFRQIMQRDGESVSFFNWLYGTERMSMEMKDVMLYRQLKGFVAES